MISVNSKSFLRSFHSTSGVLARTKWTKPKPKPKSRKNVNWPTQFTHYDKDLKVTTPIPPAVSNIKVRDDHPLWQFFSDKKYLRPIDDLDLSSRPWSVSELRRKSFDDLHSLWYNCLKERNILAREIHLYKLGYDGRTDSYEKVDDNVRTTMWRIRHVLSERDWAFHNAKEEFINEETKFLADFESQFLDFAESNDTEAFDMLSRFQKAVFGISEFIDENSVDRKFVDGLKYVATLKVLKFAPRKQAIAEFLDSHEQQFSITDAGEAFILFTCDNTPEAVTEACAAVTELRESGSSVSRYEELETVKLYLERLVQSRETAQEEQQGQEA